MATLSVSYPRVPNATFDLDYYRTKHLPLVVRLWGDAGLVGGEALVGKAAADGSESPFLAIGIIHFESAQALQQALTGEQATEIIGDVENFTNVQPLLQVNERIVPGP